MLILLIVLIYLFNPDAALSQDFIVSSDQNDADLIRIEFQSGNGIQTTLLKQYKDKLIIQHDGKEQEIRVSGKTELIYNGGEYFGLFQTEDFKNSDQPSLNPTDIEFPSGVR